MLERSRRQSRLRKILFMVGLVFLGLAALECGARVYTYRYGRETMYAPDPVLGWRMNRYSRVLENGQPMHVNADGLYNDDVPGEKGPNEIRVLCLGDSITCGMSLGGKTFPYFTQEALNRLRPQYTWRVINAGIPGYTSWHGLVLLQELAPRYKPDLLVVTFLNNEHGARPYEGPPPDGVADKFQRLLYHSELYLQLVRWYRHSSNVFDNVDLGGPRVLGVEAFGANLDVFVQESKRLGIPILFVEEAIYFSPPGQPARAAPPVSKEKFEEFRQTLVAHTVQKNQVLVRITDDVRYKRLGMGFYLPGDGIHPDAAGNALMGEIIASVIVDGRLLPSLRPGATPGRSTSPAVSP